MIKLKLKNNNISIDKLIAIIKQLRSPDGCDWDKDQTHKSLTPYLLEETYEVIEAIEKNDYNALKEELGDLLLHVLFQAELSDEKNKFSIGDSINSVCEKLINRHPHIFYDKNNPKWKKGNWEEAKQKEKKRDSIIDGVPTALPGLYRSRRIQEKAASVGFDWETKAQVIAKVDEEILELKESISENKNIEEEFGDVLFSIVNLSRHLNIDPERALKYAIDKFSNRFKKIESDLNKKKIKIRNLSFQELDDLWEKNKKKYK